MNHEEALEKTDRALEKLYEPLYSRRRDRKPVPGDIMTHYTTTSARLLSLLKTGREEQARRFYQDKKIEIENMFKEIE